MKNLSSLYILLLRALGQLPRSFLTCPPPFGGISLFLCHPISWLDDYVPGGDEIPLGTIKDGINPAELIALLPLDRPEQRTQCNHRRSHFVSVQLSFTGTDATQGRACEQWRGRCWCDRRSPDLLPGLPRSLQRLLALRFSQSIVRLPLEGLGRNCQLILAS